MSLILDDAGNPLEIIDSPTDITERLEPDAARLESERGYRTLFEQAPIGILLVSPAGVPIMCNSAIQQFLGYNESEMQACHFTQFSHPEDVATSVDLVQRLRNGEHSPLEIDKRYVRADGETVWARTAVSLVRDQCGEAECFIVMVMDNSRQHHAFEALFDSEARLQSLAARLVEVREAERGYLAREVHDVLGQLLTGLSLDLTWCDRRIVRIEEPGLRHEMASKLTQLHGLVGSMMQTVQDLASELRPGVLDSLGLAPALRFEARRFMQRSELACDLQLMQYDPGLSDSQATCFFRICQEALSNIARHADASRFSIRLVHEDHVLVLEVSDDGKGIPPERLQDPRSIGLLGMRERVRQIGAQITFEHSPGGGTTVRVTLAERNWAAQSGRSIE